MLTASLSKRCSRESRSIVITGEEKMPKQTICCQERFSVWIAEEQWSEIPDTVEEINSGMLPIVVHPNGMPVQTRRSIRNIWKRISFIFWKTESLTELL